MVWTVRTVLVMLNVLNWLAATLFVGLLLLLPVAGSPISLRLAGAALPGEAAALRLWFAAMLAIGIATAGAVHLLFRRLIAIVDTVAAGRPFSIANAGRLRAIAWALLAVQGLDLAFAIVAHGIAGAARHPVFTWSPSVTGWLAVLLLFVLAQVFARATAMQDELEATV